MSAYWVLQGGLLRAVVGKKEKTCWGEGGTASSTALDSTSALKHEVKKKAWAMTLIGQVAFLIVEIPWVRVAKT